MIIQSLVLGSSFLLVSKNSHNSIFLNSNLSFVLFWSIFSIIKLLDNLFRANNILLLLAYICYIVYVLIEIDRIKLFILTFYSILYFLIGTYFNFQIRGGDSYLSTLGALSLSFPNEVNFDLSMFAHRPVLLSLIESLSLVINDNLFIFFFQFSSILLISFIIFVFYSQSKNLLLSGIFLLTIVTTPAVFLLSIYYEIHSYLALQLVTLTYIFIHEKNFFQNQAIKDFMFSVIGFSVLLSRFEAILFFLPILYIYNKKNKLDMKYRYLISSSAIWYISLYFLNYDYKSADKILFLILGIGILVSTLAINKINFQLMSKSGLILIFLNIILAAIDRKFYDSMLKLFNIITGNYAFWGTVGVILFGLIIYQTIFSIKNDIFLISIFPLWTINLLTIVGDVGTGWRYGLSSSINRMLFSIFFLTLLNQILLWKNDKIFTN